MPKLLLKGEMSYVNLIDPVSHSKQRYYRRTTTSNNDDNEQSCMNEKHEDLDINEKEDLLPGDTLKQAYKKGIYLFFIMLNYKINVYQIVLKIEFLNCIFKKELIFSIWPMVIMTKILKIELKLHAL